MFKDFRESVPLFRAVLCVAFSGAAVYGLVTGRAAMGSLGVAMTVVSTQLNRLERVALARRTHVRYDPLMESWEIETLRRSVAMLPPGHTGAMSREEAQAVFRELEGLQQESRRYRELVQKIRELVGEGS